MTLRSVLDGAIGHERAGALLARVVVAEALATDEVPRDGVDRAVVAEALALALMDDLLQRVPTGERYVAAEQARGRAVVLDHGALRTIDAPWTGALPPGVEAFRRILVPLGYEEVGEYPLTRLRMTGRVFCHADRPEELAQYFVSELHAERLEPAAQVALRHVVEPSVDPLTDAAAERLERLAADGWLPVDEAAALVRDLLPCFGRHHPDPALADYEVLLAHSAEAAWIATEGNAFNHATDRVDDVDGLATHLLDEGWPLKDVVERSGSGRVRQTAFRADPVVRRFVAPDGSVVERSVPGSFFELISRAPRPDGAGLDLAFDAANAQGIFTMTRPPAAPAGEAGEPG